MIEFPIPEELVIDGSPVVELSESSDGGSIAVTLRGDQYRFSFHFYINCDGERVESEGKWEKC